VDCYLCSIEDERQSDPAWYGESSSEKWCDANITVSESRDGDDGLDSLSRCETKLV
jgi:hypothetical protein